MAREKQPQDQRQGTSKATHKSPRMRRRDSVEDALAATHENSVPVLPAFDTPPPPGASGTLRPNASYARGTLAPNGAGRPRTLADTTTTFTRNAAPPASGREPSTTYGSGQYGGPASASGTSGTSGASGNSDRSSGAAWYGDGSYSGYDGSLPGGIADEVYDADTYEQGAYARGARPAGATQSRALVPGRPSLGLPTLAEDRLPAASGDAASRQLALKNDDAPDLPAVLIRGASKPLAPYTPIVPRRQGPRSFLSQFIISMVAVMTIFTVLTLASPLGHSQAFAGTFQSYANAVPWVPTPTPTPKPTPVPAYVAPAGANPGQQAVINDIVAVFGPNANGAINVARCESGFDPNAWNPYAIGGSHASGVFQILYPSTWSTTSWAGTSPYNYDANIHAAYQIFSRDGFSWREWSCGIYA